MRYFWPYGLAKLIVISCLAVSSFSIGFWNAEGFGAVLWVIACKNQQDRNCIGGSTS